MNLDDPVAVALAVARQLEAAELDYGLYGGLAVAAYGVARETKDADVGVTTADASRVADLLRGCGLTASPAFDRVRFGGLVISRVTLLGGDEDHVLNTVDLVEPVSARYAAAAMGRTLRAPLRGEEIRLLAPEDVVLFKLLSTRDLDLSDALSLLEALRGELDTGWIGTEVRRLAAEVAPHDLPSRWESITRPKRDL